MSLAPGWTPDPRFEDPVFRMVFARLVTRYWANDCCLPDVAWELHRGWPGSDLVIMENAGHGIGTTGVVIDATDRFAHG